MIWTRSGTFRRRGGNNWWTKSWESTSSTGGSKEAKKPSPRCATSWRSWASGWKQSEFKEVRGKARQVDSLREQLHDGEAALAKFASPVKQLAETEAGFEEVERKRKDKEGESARLGEESAVLLSKKGLSDSTSVDALDKAKGTASRFFAVFLVAAVLTLASAFVYAQTAIASVVFFALSAAYM